MVDDDIEVKNAEMLVREIRSELKDQTYVGDKSVAQIHFESCYDTFDVIYVDDAFRYRFAGEYMPYMEFRRILTKYLAVDK
jgi:hypothetical protein